MKNKSGVSVQVTSNEFGAHRHAVPVMNDHPAPDIFAPIDEVESMVSRAAIKKRIKVAGQTLKRCALPKEYLGLTKVVAAWPDMQHARNEYGAWRRKPARPVKPTAKEIDNLDMVLRWLLWLNADERPVVFACMVSSPGKAAMMDPARRARETLRGVFNKGVSRILGRLIDDRDRMLLKNK